MIHLALAISDSYEIKNYAAINLQRSGPKNRPIFSCNPPHPSYLLVQ